ncbi:MAG: acyl carrier protein [Bacteroidota bacterium]
MKHPRFIRPLSLNERLYAAGETLAPPFALTYVLEGDGFLEDAAFQAAVAQVIEAMPALTFGRKAGRWVSNQQAPTIRCVATPLPDDWDAPCFAEGLGSGVADFQLYAGKTMVVRVLHRLMDAKGVQTVLRLLFAALRGEALQVEEAFPADVQLRAQIAAVDRPSRGGYAFRWPSLRLANSAPASYQTRVYHLGQRWDAPLAKIAALISKHLKAPCRFLIPVDLRRHQGVPPAAANLSLPIYLEVQPGQSWQEVQAQLLALLQQKGELAPEPFESLASRLPISWLRGLMKVAIGKVNRSHRFPMSGFLSDNGFVDLTTYQTPRFQVQQVVALPVFVPLAPIGLVAIHHQGGTNVAVQVPATEEANHLLSVLQEAIDEEEVPKVAAKEEEVRLEPWLLPIAEMWGRYLQKEPSSIAPTAHFSDLGGDSLQLLAMLSEMSSVYVPEESAAFMQAVLDTGGRIHLQSLGELIQQYSDQAFTKSDR